MYRKLYLYVCIRSFYVIYIYIYKKFSQAIERMIMMMMNFSASSRTH